MLPSPTAGRVVAGLLGLALPALLPSALVHAKTDQDPRRTPRHAAYSDVAFGATNEVRKADDLARLRDQRCLRQFAREQAKAMAAEERAYHQDLRRVLKKCDLDLAGENVAYGYATGEDVVEAWFDSASHRANLLEPDFETMAVVSRRSDDGVWYVAQVFGSSS